jgi:hypothetical protein
MLSVAAEALRGEPLRATRTHPSAMPPIRCPSHPSAPFRPARSMLGCYNERDRNQLRCYKKTGPPEPGRELRGAKGPAAGGGV